MITVREATIADREALVEGNQAMALETEGLRLPDARLRAGVDGALAGAARYLVAEEGGRVVGQLMLTTEWSDWRAAWVWWIQSVYTWPSHRRRGVYRRLYAAARDQAIAADAAGLRLYVDSRNAPAQAVYRDLGMDGDHYRVFEAMFNRN